MNYQILLVEDEPKTAEMVKMALETENMDVIHVDNGKSAIDKVAEKGMGYFDLIVLDLKLKGELRGDEALEIIRKIDPYVEVLVSTNYENPNEMKHLLNLKVSGYAKKGAEGDVWALVDKVKSIVEPLTKEEREAFINSLPTNPLNLD